MGRIKIENILLDNEKERVYLKDGKSYILDKKINLITSTNNNYGDYDYKIKIDDSINIDLESKLHTLYCYYEEDENTDNYLIKAIFTIDDYLMIHQLSK